MPPDTDLHESNPSDSSPLRAFPNLAQIAWQRKSLVGLGVVLGLVLGGLYYVQQDPVYQSNAQILVIKKQPDAPLGAADPRGAYFEDYLSTHQTVIKSPLIVSRAISKHKLDSLSALRGRTDAASMVMTTLVVNRDAKDSTGGWNNILNLTFRGRDPEDCRVILDAVLDSYRDFLDDTYRNVSDETVRLITQARDVLQKQLEQKEVSYRDFRQKSPLLLKTREGAYLHTEQLAAIENRRAGLILKQAEVRERLSGLEKAIGEGKDRAALLALIPSSFGVPGSVSAVPGVRGSEDSLLALLQQEKALLAEYGPGHPQVEAVRERIAMTPEYVARGTRVVDKGARIPPKTTEGIDLVQLYLVSLRQDLEETVLALRTSTTVFDSQQQEVRAMTHFELENEDRQGDIIRTRQLYESVIKRLQEINIIRDFGGYDARVIAPPLPGRKIAPNSIQVFGGALILGLLGGLGLAFQAERADQRFRSPQEIQRRLGLPVVGHIPVLATREPAADLAPEAAALNPSVCAFHRPKSIDAEAFRGVRTTLYFSTQGADHRVIQITSPSPNDGKSTVAANLAVSIAQSGKKVLLIDADLRKPKVHKLFGLKTEVGFASVMTGQTEPQQAIVPSVVPGLFLLPSGPVPANPAELLTSARLKEILDVLQQQYDFVLIDTPPVLAVTDPCSVAARVDGVLLVIRISKDGRPRAERAREILLSLGVKILGVVVNAVVEQHDSIGAAGYQHYNYGYSYGRYAYEARSSESYYHDEDGKDGADGSSSDAKGQRPGGPRKPSGGILGWFRNLWG